MCLAPAVVLGVTTAAAVVPGVWLYVWGYRRRANRSCKTEAAQWGGSLLVVSGLLYAFVLYPVMRCAQVAASRTACLHNLSNIGKAFNMYAEDNNERYPLAANWCDAISTYVNDPDTFRCPELENAFAYSVNRQVPGFKLGAVASLVQLVLAFDGPGGKDGVGGVNELQFRHEESVCVVFADGHAKSFWSGNRSGEFFPRVWDPRDGGE